MTKNKYDGQNIVVQKIKKKIKGSGKVKWDG